jgi:Arc/MetJ family transcription regulator
MSVTVNLSADEVARVKRATEVDDEKEAVAKAVREFLRIASLRELKAASGKVDYVGVEEEMEGLELREPKPQQ